MKYLTKDLYKRMQLFQFPLEDGVTLEQLAEEFEMDLSELLLEELMANEQSYKDYLPKPLYSRLFDKHGEVSFQEIDTTVLQELVAYRRETEIEWDKAIRQVKEQKQKLYQSASPELQVFLKWNLMDSEIKDVRGLDTDTVEVILYPAWDNNKCFTLQFTQVKSSWMNPLHSDDADWWLADELSVDEEQKERYRLQILFGNAKDVGQVQFTFTSLNILETCDC